MLTNERFKCIGQSSEYQRTNTKFNMANRQSKIVYRQPTYDKQQWVTNDNR